MTLPAGIATVTVTGTLLDPDGGPATGYIEFIPSVRVLHVAENTIVLPAKIVVQLVGGAFSVLLPAGDDGNPSGSSLKVIERVTGGSQYSISVLAANGATQDLSVLAPVTSNTGTPVVVGPQGPATTDASLLTTGTLNDARLPAGANTAAVAAKATVASVTAEAATARAAEAKINGVSISGVPTSGQVPTATSGTASTWQTPAAGGGAAPVLPAYAGGVAVTRYADLPYHAASGGGSSTFTQAEFRVYPLLLATAATIVSLSVRSGGGGSAGSVIRFGIYSLTSGVPDALVVDAGTVASTSSFTNITASLSQVLAAGLYAVAFVPQGAPATAVTLNTITGGTGLMSTVRADTVTAALNGDAYVGWKVAGIAGALPANITGLAPLVGGASPVNHPEIAIGVAA